MLEFQSTFPLQGTTRQGSLCQIGREHFNPRSHCRERLCQNCEYNMNILFQSTFPLQGTTNVQTVFSIRKTISIHVPIAGNDQVPYTPFFYFLRYFNPRSHCRERLCGSGSIAIPCSFQSTFPLQGTTLRARLTWCRKRRFQSTFPLQGTTESTAECGGYTEFQSTFPLQGTTGEL